MNSKSKAIVLYVHGKDGSAAEAEHYRPLFPEADVVGFDYHSENPWSAKTEFSEKIAALRANYDQIFLISVSIGAYFSMSADISDSIRRAWLISPIVDMERLILSMLSWGGARRRRRCRHGRSSPPLSARISPGSIFSTCGRTRSSGARRQKSSAAAPTPSSPSKPSAPLPDASAQASRSWRAASTGSTPPNR